jgi:hypothetical protein
MLAAAVVAAACGPADSLPAGPTHAVTDSAGITIVENGPPDGVPLHDLRGRQVLDLGAVDGPEEFLFSWVGGVELMDDGRLVVADRSGRLRYYGRDGRYLSSFGRKGEGPGEFQLVLGLWQRSADTLEAFDAYGWRVTVVSDDGLVSVHPVRPPGPNPAEGRGLLSDGSVIVSERIFRIPQTGFAPIQRAIRRATLDDAEADTLFLAEDVRFGRVTSMAAGGTFVSSPVFEAPYVTSAAVDRITTSDCKTPEYRDLAPDGDLRRIVRWDGGDLTVEPSDVEAYRAARLAAAEDEEDRRIEEETMEIVPVNEVFPACKDIHAVDSETAWVKEYPRLPEAPDDWLLFENGELVAAVRLPGEARLMAVTGDRVATVERDDLDVEHVRVYELPEMSP